MKAVDVLDSEELLSGWNPHHHPPAAKTAIQTLSVVVTDAEHAGDRHSL